MSRTGGGRGSRKRGRSKSNCNRVVLDSDLGECKRFHVPGLVIGFMHRGTDPVSIVVCAPRELKFGVAYACEFRDCVMRWNGVRWCEDRKIPEDLKP